VVTTALVTTLRIAGREVERQRVDRHVLPVEGHHFAAPRELREQRRIGEGPGELRRHKPQRLGRSHDAVYFLRKLPQEVSRETVGYLFQPIKNIRQLRKKLCGLRFKVV